MVWKHGAECPVLLTFDLDAETMWEGRTKAGVGDYNKPSILSMGQYGPRIGVPRLLDILDEYDVSACFFTPGRTAERYPDLMADIHDAGHEIANHGYSHLNVVEMDDEEEYEELKKTNDIIEDITGEPPKGFRSPAADLGPRTINRLIDMGFEYDSSLLGGDLPYFVQGDSGEITEVPFYWSQDDAAYFNFNMYPLVQYQAGISEPSHVLDVWESEFDACYDWGLPFHLLMHPQIIGRPHRAKMLEELLQYIRGHSDVWFATPLEVARHWRDSVDEANRDVRTV